MFSFYNFKITVYYKVPYNKDNIQVMKGWRMMWNSEKKLWSKTISYNGLEDQIFFVEGLPIFQFDAVDVQCDIEEHKTIVYREIEQNKIKFIEQQRKRNEDNKELEMVKKEYTEYYSKLELEDNNINNEFEVENFEVYYKNVYNQYRVYNYETKQYRIDERIPRGINCYYLLNNYSLLKRDSKDMTNDEISKYMDEQLIKYAEDLVIWSDELYNCKTLKAPFNYLASYKTKYGKQFYRNAYETIFLFYKLYGSRIDLYNEIHKNKISYTEYLWFEKCNNGGLVYLQENKTAYCCFGYDFSLNYPNLMASKEFKFPTKEGKEEILNELPNKLKYGIYRVKFDMNTINDKFKILFKIVKTNCYTHYDLNFVKKKFPDVKFELIQDNKPNCLVYSKDDLITGSELFYPWLSVIKKLREELPKNGLVKHLASKLWGVLIEGNTDYYTIEELQENNIDFTETGKHILVDTTVKKNGDLLFEIAKKEGYYKKNIRIKPFLTAFARINCCNLALENINHVVRIQTDSVVFDTPLSKSILCKYPNLKVEEKTTGDIYFENVNSYYKI
jgi:hypothetical protein